MKLMVCLVVVLAASCAAGGKQDDEGAAKRQLLEGNFGVRIQPSIEASFNSQGGNDGSQNELREGPPQKEYGPPKISDVLTGQGVSFPAAIRSHLYSPVQVYQPNLGSPTTFEVSPPVPSPLAYSEHKIYQPSTFNGLNQGLNQNIQQSLDQQVNPFPGFGQILPPRPDLPNEFRPNLIGPTGQNPINPIQPQQIYRQVFSEQSGVIPQDIYQQINMLSQMNFERNLQDSVTSEQQRAQGSENAGQQQEQTTQRATQLASQKQSFDIRQGQIIEEQNRNLVKQQSSSTTQQPQAVSYASFFQSLPSSSQSQFQSQFDQSGSSPVPPQPIQRLPQPQSPPLFQTTQAVRTKSVFQPIETISTTPQPLTTLYTTVNQTPRRIGVVKIRQEENSESTTPQSFTVSTVEPQVSSSTSSYVASEEKSQSTSTQENTSSTRSTPTTRYRMTFRQFTRPTPTPRSTQHSVFPSRPTFSPLLKRRTTVESFSTLPTSTLPPTSAIVETSSTSLFTPALETLSSLPPQTGSSTFSTLPPQPSIQTVSTLELQPTVFTSPSTTPQPELVQSTLTPVSLFTPEQITSTSLQPSLPTTLQPLQQLSSLQPIPVTQPQSSSVQPHIPEVTPFPAQRLSYEVQSEPQSVIKISETKEEKFSQQFSQPFPQQPFFQPQYFQGSQQIQQQLQLIQQQLQLLQQQQQPFIQQQPQPAQIIQQQFTPFPQHIQLGQSQHTPEPQPVQLVQQQPQLIQQQSQLVTAQPQFVTPQPQLAQPQLVQTQPQLIQTQPQPFQPQLIQPQPQLIQPQPQLIQQQPQLIQSLSQPVEQPQLIESPPQSVQIVEQKPEPQTTPQPVTLLEKPQPSPAIETQNSQQGQQNKETQKEENEKQEINEVQKNYEGEAFYNQLLQNNLYSEELYASLQPQSLYPVPVGISSYPSAPTLHSPFPTAFTAAPFTVSPFSASPLHSAHLHSPHLHPAHLHTSHLHSPALHGQYHSHAFPSVQFFGKHANAIFGAGWKRKK